MDETLIRAIVAGCVLAAIGGVATLIWKASLRVKLALAALVVAYITYAALVGFGPVAALVVLAVSGFFFVRGYRKKNVLDT